jgi:phosphatidylserine/phosphatidylglycerophosphate/cardiolipin synthase-like enzyme
MRKLFASLAIAAFCSPALARTDGILEQLSQQLFSTIVQAPEEQVIEYGFSPNGKAEALVLKVINTSKRSIRLAAYSFTSPAVVRALTSAKKRGVDVQIVVDEKGNKSKSGTAALNLISGAGIPARTNARYAILHDKYIVADERHVQTGSFNYSRAAANSNSENVLVIWNNPELARPYLDHWRSRFGEASPYRRSF